MRVGQPVRIVYLGLKKLAQGKMKLFEAYVADGDELTADDVAQTVSQITQ